MILTATFNALNREAQFTKEMLGTGATQIRYANYATKGLYFQAFTSLSTGLERIGKLCLMLDHYITTQGSFPTQPELKQQIGHKLNLLYIKSQEILQRRSLALNLTKQPLDSVHHSIINVLHDFALGDRYSNIDVLTGRSSLDPVERWFFEVDSPLYQSNVTQSKKDRIEKNAKLAAELMGAFTYVLHISEDGEELTDFESASRRTGIWEAVAPYRQLYVLQIIRYWTELLMLLGNLAQSVPGEHVPFFGEIFALFYNEDSYFKSRKTWEKV